MELFIDNLGVWTQSKNWNHSIDEQKLMYYGTQLGDSFRVKEDVCWMFMSDTLHLPGAGCHIVGVSPFTDGETVYLKFVVPLYNLQKKKSNVKYNYNIQHIPISRGLLKRSRILLIEREFY